MSTRRKPAKDIIGNPALDGNIASFERQLRKAGRFERRLDVHAVVDEVRDELSVRLRLVPAAHDAERNA